MIVQYGFPVVVVVAITYLACIFCSYCRYLLHCSSFVSLCNRRNICIAEEEV